ncbi:MAG: glycosyltransferase family 2 protein [Protaetiibacter sp.]
MNAPIRVVTVAYNSDGVLPAFVESLGEASSRPLRLVIVDNGPVAPAPLRAPRDDVDVEVLPAGGNLGYGTAVNRGAAIDAQGVEWIVVANPDIVFRPGAIDELIRVGQEDDTVGQVGPLILTSDGAVYPSARRLPSLRNGIGHALFNKIWPANPWTRAYHSDRELPPSQRDAGWLSGAAFLVRAAAFREVGGFDESYFMYFEDVDLSARLGRAGWRMRYAPSAVVVHIGAHSTGASSAMVRAHHASAYQYLARRYRAWYLWPLRAVLRLGLAVRARIVNG